jgi:hypothetical protein
MSISTIPSGTGSAYHIKQDPASALNPIVTPATGNGADAPDADSYKVDLSQEAQELMAEEAQEEDGNTAMIDIAIEKIKEQIKEVMEQLAQLKNAKGEAAETQRQMLTDMLVSLLSQVMELMAKKLEMQG